MLIAQQTAAAAAATTTGATATAEAQIQIHQIQIRTRIQIQAHFRGESDSEICFWQNAIMNVLSGVAEPDTHDQILVRPRPKNPRDTLVLVLVFVLARRFPLYLRRGSGNNINRMYLQHQTCVAFCRSINSFKILCFFRVNINQFFSSGAEWRIENLPARLRICQILCSVQLCALLKILSGPLVRQSSASGRKKSTKKNRIEKGWLWVVVFICARRLIEKSPISLHSFVCLFSWPSHANWLNCCFGRPCLLLSP